MKKFIKFFAVLLCCTLCVPLLSACEANAGTELLSIRFTQDVYEVDEGQTVKLNFKTYPSTATGYEEKISFVVKGLEGYEYNIDKNGNFKFYEGSINSQAIIEIRYGHNDEDYDICTVIKKEYPTSIYFEKSSDIINNNSLYQLKLMAQLPDGSTKAIDRSEYDIELTSSVPNVVSVSDTTMFAQSLGKSGKTTITARIKKLSGTYVGFDMEHLQGIEAKIDLIVVENPNKALIGIGGANSFIEATSSSTKSSSNSYETTANSVIINVQLYFDDVLINYDDVSINVICKTANATITQTDGNFTISLSSSGTAEFAVISNTTDSSGNPQSFVFYISKT